MKANHEWKSMIFGISTSRERNSVTIREDGSVELKTTIYDPISRVIEPDGKGGKLTAYYDGISYYFTEIDPIKENFEFTATFTVDYLNPNPDGQEGFGILLRDSIGIDGDGEEQYATNSVGILAKNVSINGSDGTVLQLKPGIASRFVTGLTPKILEIGAEAIAKNGRSITQPLKNDNSAVVKEGNSYTFTLKKTNTGYHAIYTEGSETYEAILYGTEKLLQIEANKLYLGVAAARGVDVTVSDFKLIITDPLQDSQAIPEPIIEVKPKIEFKQFNQTGNSHYELELLSNIDGKVRVYDSTDRLVSESDMSANYAKFILVNLNEGDNHFKAELILGESRVAEAITVIHHKTYEGYYKGKIGTYLFVSPEGTSEGDGTLDSPLDIFTAIDYLQPGQMIELASGVYSMNQTIKIHRANKGTSTLYKCLGTYDNEPAIFDFSKGGSLILNGSYWKLDNIHVCHTQGDVKGVTIGGHNNTIQRIKAYQNGDTGIQISGDPLEHPDFWPSHNIVENCDSFDNVDPGHNNADGFAAKIATGAGNIFRGDISYNNVDDGWDLFSKVEAGPIGEVLIENCITYRNGTNLEGNAHGDGNGFKLGGDGIAIPHILKNSLAYDNDADGVTSNSNPAIQIYQTISVQNRGADLSLYGKGKAEVTAIVEGVITWGGEKENIYGNQQVENHSENHFEQVDKKWFVKSDKTLEPRRHSDGSFELDGLFELVKEELHPISVKPISSKVLIPCFRLK